MRLLIFLFFIASFNVLAQDEPQLFEPALISNGGVFGLTLSPDGKDAFWVRSNGKRDTLIIMESHQVDGKWQQPKPAAFSGKEGVWKDIDPMFTPDGNMILFQSDRPVENKPGRKGFDIWAVKRIKKGWSSAFHLGNNINSEASESYASMSKNGNIYFMKNNENGVGQSDIFVSRFVKGFYQLPENIGMPINTNERESNPYISPDEDYILFFSTNPNGFGEVDLYISYNKNGNWTEPKNLGQPINSSMAEFCPMVHRNEKRIYFSRQKKDGERFIENIYFYPFSMNNLK